MQPLVAAACRGAKLVLREGAKFPALSLHLAPALQPLRMLTGPGAAKELAAALREHPPNAPPVFSAAEVSSTTQLARAHPRSGVCTWPLSACVHMHSECA